MWNDIEKAIEDLKTTLSEYKKYQKDYAIKEKKYRVALSKRLLELRAEGQAVTHLADIARGMEDIAEGLVRSAEEGINFYKLKIREMESQYNKEWGVAKYS